MASTGDSSVSSGSAGERSISPARSDESADSRPTLRPLSHASSSATLTSTQPQLSRPTSSLNLAKTRKRQAPAPPPPPSAPTPAPHTNGKVKTCTVIRFVELSYRSVFIITFINSPTSSEISSAEAVRAAQVPQATNLTSVVSTSSLSLSSSRGKRRAPPPPKPPPMRQDDSNRPSAIPEESESPVPTKSSVEDVTKSTAEDPTKCPIEETTKSPAEDPIESPAEDPIKSPAEDPKKSPAEDPKKSPAEDPIKSPAEVSTPLVNGEAHHEPPQQQQPSSPTSSHISSVSSLSSVEQQQANNPLLPPPPDVESPPPPSSASECTNLGATFSNSPPLPYTIPSSSNMQPPHQSFPTTNKPPSPTAARTTVAAGVTLGMHHEAATATSLSHSTNSSKMNSRASGIISPDRLAESEGLQRHHHQDYQIQDQDKRHHSSQELPSASTVLNQKRQKLSTEGVQEGNNLPVMQSRKNQERSLNFPSDGVSAKNIPNLDDAIVPQNVGMEGIPDIPTFRIVTKSHTAVHKDDVSKKFIADGKTQKVSEEEKYGSKGRSATKSKTNPLARGKGLVRQDNIVFENDDFEFNEDMFEPRNVSDNTAVGQSRQVSTHLTSIPVKRGAPLPTPRKNAPVAPTYTASGSKFAVSTTDHSIPLISSRTTTGEGNQNNRTGGFSHEEKVVWKVDIQPKPTPRTQPQQKKMAPTPPVVVQRAKNLTPVKETMPHNEKLQGSQDNSLNDTLNMGYYNDNITSCDSSRISHLSQVEEFEGKAQEPPDEEFKVHVSKLSKGDADVLSLLSEEEVDTPSVSSKCQSRTSSVVSKMSDSSQEYDRVSTLPVQNDNTLNARSSSSTSSHNSSTTTPLVPPIAALPAQTAASSYRAGYLAMMAELKNWKDADSLHNVGLESSDSDSDSPHDSLQELPKVMGSPQGTSEGVLRGSPLRPRLASSSSLCSDTDHEVQTRTASFSSETSEENVDNARVKSDKTPAEENLLQNKLIGLNFVRETNIVNQQNIADNESISSRSKTGSINSVEDNFRSDVQQKKIPISTRKLEVINDLEAPLLKKEVINKSVISKPQEKSSENGSEVLKDFDIQSVSSLSITDSEGDDRGKTLQNTPEENKVFEEVKTEILELPLSSVRFPAVEGTIQKSSDAASQDLSNDKLTTTNLGNRKSSVSSASSASSNNSFVKTNHNELTAQVSQEVTKKKIEIHLEAAFAELKDESKSSLFSSEESTVHSAVKKTDQLPECNSGNTWGYKLPDPPTPFKDGPSSKVTDESSSISSETVPEILSDVPSGFKDSPCSSISESRPIDIIEKTESMKERKVTKETCDSVSNISSRKSSSSSHSSTSYKFEDKAKQNVINELKSAIKETNNNEPRIVELKPKTRNLETIVYMPKAHVKEMTPSTTKLQTKDNVTKAETFSVRANIPVQHSYIPRVVAKVPIDNKEFHGPILSNVVNKTSRDSISSYESCNSPEPDAVLDRTRSGSNTSYESAPPPIPDAPIPTDSDVEVRSSRSSSDVSDGNSRTMQTSLAHQNSDSGNERSKNRARVMNFSISTYTSRSEETSYDKKIIKSESFNHQLRPKMGQLSTTDSFSTQSNPDQLKEDKKEPVICSETSVASSDLEKPSLPKKPQISEFSSAPVKYSPFLLKQAQSAKPAVPPNKPTLFGMHSETNLNVNQPVVRVNSLNDRPSMYRNTSNEGHFVVPDPPRPLLRLKRVDSQEQLERTTSLVNLATPNYELRKAQSSYDISYDGISSMFKVPFIFVMPKIFV
ncbi:hypothetical protein Hamer_G002850 [Homarus americanus]|uniref:Uncharacterized protein n=1 Tax=Homarus americanus TaxID=6706 RepID=A0A8J5JYE7_HOMAM|nr:hypothetical protein Hamer_G002850 [Homarus americanus]